MKTACIGWGSLIWRSEGLKIKNHWFEDGPILPIEFTRISSDNKSLKDFKLEVPNIFENAHNEKTEYLIKGNWIKVFPKHKAKWKKKSNLFSTQLIKASLDNQPLTIGFLEKEFEVYFDKLLNE